MRRRNLIALLGGAAASWPFLARAQQRVPIIAILGSGAADTNSSKMQMELLGASIREFGLVDGKDYVFETRWAGSDSSRFPPLAAELLALHPTADVVSPKFDAQKVLILSIARWVNLAVVFPHRLFCRLFRETGCKLILVPICPAISFDIAAIMRAAAMFAPVS